ncbi:MAG: hypothetical protein ABSF99_03630 [Anaerolineales bacterium]
MAIRPVIDAVWFLRAREKLDDAELKTYLTPYWLAWSGRKRLDGRPYDPGNITWLSEWALNGSIPPPGGLKAVESTRPEELLKRCQRHIQVFMDFEQGVKNCNIQNGGHSRLRGEVSRVF